MNKRYKLFLRHLITSELLRNTSVLISGTIFAQLIPILLQPFLRRLFSPETFGAYSVYVSIVGILIIISSFKYESAIVLPGKDKESVNILSLSLILNFLFCVFIALLFFIFDDEIAKLLNIPDDYLFLIYLVPPGTFLINTFQNFNFWLIRKKAFFAISVNKFVRRGTEGIFQTLFALLQKIKGLFIGDLIGQAANVMAVIFQSRKCGFSFKDVSLVKIRYVSRKYSDFPKYNMLPALLSACSYLFPAIFINRFYSAEHTGYFDLSKLMLSIPFAFMASSFSNVLLQRISEKFLKNQSLLKDLVPVVLAVIFIAVFEVILIRAYGSEIFEFVFGKEWRIAGVISRYMVWAYALNFVISSLSSVFISMRNIRIYSVWQVIYFCSIMILLFFRGVDFEVFIRRYVIIEIACYVLVSVIMAIMIMTYENKLKAISKVKIH